MTSRRFTESVFDLTSHFQHGGHDVIYERTRSVRLAHAYAAERRPPVPDLSYIHSYFVVIKCHPASQLVAQNLLIYFKPRPLPTFHTDQPTDTQTDTHREHDPSIHPSLFVQ